MHELEINEKLRTIIKENNRLKLSGNYEEFLKFNKVMTYCYKSLSYEYQRIFRKCYLEEEFKLWWEEEYSKTSFYRKRIKVITSFVNLFEMKYENFNDIAN